MPLSSISSVDSRSTTVIKSNEPFPQESIVSRAAEGLVLPGSPFENILKEIFLKLATQEEDAMRLRTLALDAEQHWRKELLQKLGEEDVLSAKKNRQNRLASNFAHALEPLPVMVAGLTALAAGASVPLAILAIGGITIGALMALDSALGEPAKRAIASALARGESEGTQTWMNRIYMVTGITTLACSIGLGLGTFGATEGLAKVISVATSTAANVSDVAARGAQVFTERRVNTQNALLLELEESLRHSDRKLKDDLATLKHLNQSVKDLFDTLESSLKFDADCSSRIFSH